MMPTATAIVAIFQLHHTGIKTFYLFLRCFMCRLFQLHHTGIKTIFNFNNLFCPDHFNCTIQELKQH